MNPISDAEMQEYRDMVVACLVKYGGLSESDARLMVVNDPILSKAQSEMQRLMIFHEVPYSEAMSMLYGKSNPKWYKDPKLWPPPPETDYWPPNAK